MKQQSDFSVNHSVRKGEGDRESVALRNAERAI